MGLELAATEARPKLTHCRKVNPCRPRAHTKQENNKLTHRYRKLTHGVLSRRQARFLDEQVQDLSAALQFPKHGSTFLKTLVEKHVISGR